MYNISSILITRPIDEPKKLLSQLQQIGVKGILFPTLSIELLPKDEILAALQTIESCQKIIVTSQYATQQIHKIAQLTEYLTAWHADWFAVGRKTSDGLSAWSITTPAENQETSEGLLALPAFQNVRGQRILILKGEGGRDYLVQSLQARGAIVHYLNLYRRKLPFEDETFDKGRENVRQLLKSRAIQAIHITSAEGLQNLHRLLPEIKNYLTIPVIVPSQRVYEIAEKQGHQKIILAKNASDAALLAEMKMLRHDGENKQ